MVSFSNINCIVHNILYFIFYHDQVKIALYWIFSKREMNTNFLHKKFTLYLVSNCSQILKRTTKNSNGKIRSNCWPLFSIFQSETRFIGIENCRKIFARLNSTFKFSWIYCNNNLLTFSFFTFLCTFPNIEMEMQVNTPRRCKVRQTEIFQ
jgi:hypothetical protein